MLKKLKKPKKLTSVKKEAKENVKMVDIMFLIKNHFAINYLTLLNHHLIKKVSVIWEALSYKNFYM